jgi:hypothetical protein
MKVLFAMMPKGSLLAWIESKGGGEFVGAFVGEDAAPGATRHFPGRAPATGVFHSPHEAIAWLEARAAEFNLPIKWISDVPGVRRETRASFHGPVPPDPFVE